jgi:hypothetical protein
MCLRLFTGIDNSSAITDTVCQSNKQQSSTRNQHFSIEVPENINISPHVILHYLKEKLTNIYDIQNDETPSNILIRPKQSTTSLSTTMDIDICKKRKSSFDHSPDNSNAPSKVRFFKVEQATIFCILTGCKN